jgi:predicted alpha/beta-fold hydrolase
MDDVLGGFYSNRFLQTLRHKVAHFNDRFPGLIDAERVWACRSIVEYDHLVTAPLHGFSDAWDYYERSSSAPFIPAIRRPTLLLSSTDDPLIPGKTLPTAAAAANPAVAPHWVAQGGHLGFVGGSFSTGLRWWMEEAIENAFIAAEGSVREDTARLVEAAP